MIIENRLITDQDLTLYLPFENRQAGKKRHSPCERDYKQVWRALWVDGDNRSFEGVLGHIDFNKKAGKIKMPDRKLRDLINHFNKYRLRNSDFEFPDLIGAAYEYLIGQFADSAGKKGGEFYTPRDVVRLRVRILKPQEGIRVYDPCAGSGGMMIHSKQYVEEHGGNPFNLGLYVQDSNGSVWSMCKMNMILHGIADANIQNDDVLESPLSLC